LKAYTLYVVLLRSGALCIFGLDLAVVQECSIVDLLQSFRPFFSCLDGLDANVLVYNKFGAVSKNILMVLMPMYCFTLVLSPVSWRSWYLQRHLDGLDAHVLVYSGIISSVLEVFAMVLSPVSWRSWHLQRHLDGLDAHVLVYSGIISSVLEVLAHLRWYYLQKHLDGCDAYVLLYSGIISSVLEVLVRLGNLWKGLIQCLL